MPPLYDIPHKTESFSFSTVPHANEPFNQNEAFNQNRAIVPVGRGPRNRTRTFRTFGTAALTTMPAPLPTKGDHLPSANESSPLHPV